MSRGRWNFTIIEGKFVKATCSPRFSPSNGRCRARAIINSEKFKFSRSTPANPTTCTWKCVRLFPRDVRNSFPRPFTAMCFHPSFDALIVFFFRFVYISLFSAGPFFSLVSTLSRRPEMPRARKSWKAPATRKRFSSVGMTKGHSSILADLTAEIQTLRVMRGVDFLRVFSICRKNLRDLHKLEIKNFKLIENSFYR